MSEVSAIVFAFVLRDEDGAPQGICALRELPAAGSLGVHSEDVLQRGGSWNLDPKVQRP